MRTATENRLAVAYHLADFLTAQLGTVDLETLRAFSADEWRRVAEMAGRPGYEPSPETRSTVVGILRERQSTADPFAGL